MHILHQNPALQKKYEKKGYPPNKDNNYLFPANRHYNVLTNGARTLPSRTSKETCKSLARARTSLSR